jgi:hypothetical protein
MAGSCTEIVEVEGCRQLQIATCRFVDLECIKVQLLRLKIWGGMHTKSRERLAGGQFFAQTKTIFGFDTDSSIFFGRQVLLINHIIISDINI